MTAENIRQKKQQDAEKTREDFKARQAATIQRDHDVRDLVNNVIVQYVVYGDDVEHAFLRGARNDELRAAWLRYQTARHDFVAAKLRNMMNLQLEFGHGSYEGDPRSSLFWEYLDRVIAPAFSAFDRCLYLAYQKTEVGNDSSAVTVMDAFHLCAIEPQNITQHFSRLKMSRWDQFKICIQEYAFFVDMAMRKKEQAIQDDKPDYFVEHPGELAKGLQADCGKLPTN